MIIPLWIYPLAVASLAAWFMFWVHNNTDFAGNLCVGKLEKNKVKPK